MDEKNPSGKTTDTESNLHSLAKLRFKDLRRIEVLILNRLPHGPFDSKSETGLDDHAARIESTLRSEIIRWLCTDREARAQMPATGMDIKGVIVTGDLDLSFLTIDFLFDSACALSPVL
jgi:hypothetical protein